MADSFTVWTFEPDEHREHPGAWRELATYAGPGARVAARQQYDSIKWRTAYGELFAITRNGAQPLPVREW